VWKVLATFRWTLTIVAKGDSKRRERKFVSEFLGYIGQAVGISRTDKLRANSWQDYWCVCNSRYCRDNLLRHLLDIGVISSINMGSTTGKECCLLHLLDWQIITDDQLMHTSLILANNNIMDHNKEHNIIFLELGACLSWRQGWVYWTIF
jgi:hypothetical protein